MCVRERERESVIKVSGFRSSARLLVCLVVVFLSRLQHVQESLQS